MTTPNVHVRRATVDDVEKLIKLWKDEGLPYVDLEKRFKEFQLLESEKGEILGAIGFLIIEKEGQLHSEAFTHPEQADELRTVLWERAQVQAQNHGLIRIWTQLEAPFWHSNGLQNSDQEMLKKLPESFASESQEWAYIQLRDEAAMAISLDKEFNLFKETEREQTQKIFRQARVLKMIAAVLAIILIGLVIVWAVFFMKFRRDKSNSEGASWRGTPTTLMARNACPMAG